MAKENSVWGIDIGQRALKALKLQAFGGQLQAVAFEIVEHPQILSDPEADRQELIRSALDKFLSTNSVAGSEVCVSVPGQSSFTRFVKLPPVDAKKIPEIVRFEAEQQIPFAIDEVIWRWQTFTDADSPDVEVGIFAMKREDIGNMLAYFTGVGMNVDVVQMAPLALYNFMAYDGQAAEQGATLLADIGAEKSDLVVSDRGRIWTRTVQIGGNNFTEALVKSFKLSFSKAEKLKRTAASSKYARQIFQAMRPVFADLVQEIQRSVGYYTSLHREARFKKLVGLGNGFRLPGLQKFLEQNLSIPVVRVDGYNKLRPAAGVNAAVFNDNALSFAVAYGLALQGLGEARVATNLLPAQIARSRQWQRKRPWFAGVAAVMLLILFIIFYRTWDDRSALAIEPGGDLARAESIGKELAKFKLQYINLANQGTPEAQRADGLVAMYAYRDYWPSLLELVSRGIAEQARDQALLDEYAAAQGDEQVKAALAKISGIKRDKRRMFFIESMTPLYREDIQKDKSAAAPSLMSGAVAGPAGARGFEITIYGRTPLSEMDANPALAAIRRNWTSLAASYPAISVVETNQALRREETGSPGSPSRMDMYSKMNPATIAPTADTGALGPKTPDPIFPADPAEDMAKDTRFTLTLVVTVNEQAAKDGAAAGK